MHPPIRILLFIALGVICSSLVFAQEKTPSQKENKQAGQAQTSAGTPTSTKLPLAFGLTEDTPVKIRLTRTMSSKDAKVDEKVDFEVLEDVKVGDVVVIPHGAMAIGTVTKAHPKRRMARGGKLDINIDYVQLADGEKVPLRAVKGGSGGGHTGAMTGAIVASGILFFPAAPFFLFMHGKDITIPKGTEITAYIAADTPLDPAKFAGNTTAISSSSAPLGQSTETPDDGDLSTIVVKSTPDGADIKIDGKFFGSTPSTVRLGPGEHSIVIEKAGFNLWQRTISLSKSGNITVDATLDKSP